VNNWKETEVVLGVNKVEKLSQLLPHPWHEVWDEDNENNKDSDLKADEKGHTVGFS
jgi:hypothetical protein